MISIKQLNYALAVEKNLHFKKAAEQCHVSQSALSTALNELEKQLGLQIFERDNKKVLVTPLGQEVLHRAREIVVRVDDLAHLADSQKSPLSFPVSVGVIPTIAPYLLPRILPELSSQYPKAKIRVVEEQSHVLVEKVTRGEIDTAILALPFPCDNLLALEFWQEDFYWVTQANDKLAKRKKINSELIDQSTLMLLKEGHCLKDHILDACRFSAGNSESSQANNHGLAATSLTTLMEMVRGGLGTTLVPAMALKQLVPKNGGLSAVQLDEPGPHRRLAFLIRPNYTRMSSIDALIAICKTALAE